MLGIREWKLIWFPQYAYQLWRKYSNVREPMQDVSLPNQCKFANNVSNEHLVPPDMIKIM